MYIIACTRLHQRSKVSVVVYTTTYTTCLTTAMVYGSYTLVYNCHIPWLVVKLHVQLELNTVSHLCNKIDTLFQLKQ